MLNFLCKKCGRQHNVSMSYTFRAPHYYNLLTEEQQARNTLLEGDTCTISHPQAQHTDYFVRVTLTVPVKDRNTAFTWDIWTAIDHGDFFNYKQYISNFSAPEPPRYKGWIANMLPDYPGTCGLKGDIIPGTSPGQLNKFEPYETDHPLYVHFHEGIPMREAVSVAGTMCHEEAPAQDM
ncbi:MAG: DUF2199 domain-containing protein [Alphaproteobacteria bacterium]|nr:DUF2199 domain-containing protein [Alphaproteobacteria bacterium]